VGTRRAPVLGSRAVADPVRKIEAEALKLPAKQRARIAERLIASLEDEAEPESQPLWLEEAERRLDELFSGKVTSNLGPRAGARRCPTVRTADTHIRSSASTRSSRNGSG